MLVLVVFTFLGEVLTNKYVAIGTSVTNSIIITLYCHYIALYVLALYYSCCVAMAIARYNILYTLHCATAAGQAQVHVQEQRVSC